MSIMFASIGEPNAIKKSGFPHNFFSKCAIKRGIHLVLPPVIQNDNQKFLAMNIKKFSRNPNGNN
jgi:hypothetical protein